MVKKIRVLDEPVATTPMDASPEALYELQKTMDWKLWEILQIMQRLEKSLSGMEISIPDADD